MTKYDPDVERERERWTLRRSTASLHGAIQSLSDVCWRLLSVGAAYFPVTERSFFRIVRSNVLSDLCVFRFSNGFCFVVIIFSFLSISFLLFSSFLSLRLRMPSRPCRSESVKRCVWNYWITTGYRPCSGYWYRMRRSLSGTYLWISPDGFWGLV